MYHNSFSGRGGFNRGNSRGGSFRGRRTIRTFDPTGLINSAGLRSDTQKEEYKVVNQFSDFAVDESLKRNIIEHGYKVPTPIQDQAIPVILDGRDLIGIANTGTGKTAAFLIPLINKVIDDKNHKVLILTPTRELAAQIRDEFFKFAKDLNIYCALCIGGADMRRQERDLYRNPNFVIGTPGRLTDMIRNRKLNLSGFHSIVLDEADRMVDIGFINEIKYFISLLPKERLSLFFSATIGGKIREILENFVQNPVIISASNGESLENIEQKVIRVIDPSRKVDQLHDLLKGEDFEKVLIFGRTKHGVQRLSEELSRRGFRSDAIHGNKRQNQRLRTLDDFRKNYIKILIATDVAARGLDIPNVSHVINFDLPETQDAYTHRIGRTGRAGKQGYALTFVG